MKAAVVYYPTGKREKLQKISKALANGIETQGYQVDIIDATVDVNSRLGVYQYILVGTDVQGLFNSKPHPGLGKFLRNAGMIGGKRSCAFMLPKPLFAQKSLSQLMATLEGEGMFVKYSDLIGDEQTAFEIGRKLDVSV